MYLEKKVNQTTMSNIIAEYDPEQVYFTNGYHTDCYIHTTIYNPVSPFLEAVNKHRIYSDGQTTFRFIAWIPELSFNSIPHNTHTSYSSNTNTYSNPNTLLTEYEPPRSGGEFLILTISLVVIIFISLCVAFIIRRARMQRMYQSTSVEEVNYMSEEEVSSEVDNTPQMQPQQMQTTYPIFVTNSMQTNPMQQMQSPYPIFVTTNPMQSNPMQQTMTMTNPQIIFPQPTLFYPQSTNQN